MSCKIKCVAFLKIRGLLLSRYFEHIKDQQIYRKVNTSVHIKSRSLQINLIKTKLGKFLLVAFLIMFRAKYFDLAQDDARKRVRSLFFSVYFKCKPQNLQMPQKVAGATWQRYRTKHLCDSFPDVSNYNIQTYARQVRFVKLEHIAFSTGEKY